MPAPHATVNQPSHWMLLPASALTAQRAVQPVALADISALMDKVGRSSSDAVAEQILHMLGQQVPLAQCTIFSFLGMARPRVVGMGDRARTGALPLISQDYSERFYLLDGSQRVMQAELARLAKDNTVERKFSFEPFKLNTFFTVRQYGNPAFDARGSFFKNPVGNQI